MAMNEHSRDEMTALLRAIAPRPGPAGPDCLDDTTIATVVDGTLDPADRAATIEHLATCARCRAAVAGVHRLAADAVLARAIARVESTGAAWRWRVPLGIAAAAALVLLVVWPRAVDDGGLIHRAPTITAVTQPVPLAPLGTVADAPSLTWGAVARADRYRVTLFDTDGRVIFETQLGDTVIRLPAAITLRPGRTYLWKVEARTGYDRWAASPLVEFALAPDGTP